MRSDEVRAEILGILREISDRQWEMAEALCLIFDNGWYRDWGYCTFKSYLESELHFKDRQAQYMRRAWAWHLTLSPKGQAWAKTIHIRVLRRFLNVINDENWEEWRDRLSGISTNDADKMWTRIVKEQNCNAREILVRRVMRETGGMKLVERICAMRTHGLLVDEVAESLGVDSADVRSSSCCLKVFVPPEVYESIRKHDGVYHVELELLRTVLEWHAMPELGTGTDNNK
jgi:hypothetical protein